MLRQGLTAVLKHLRAILRLPAHLTHISTAEIWSRAELPMSYARLDNTVQQHPKQLLDKLEHPAQNAPDITTTTVAAQHLRAQVGALETILHVSCPYCQDTFVTEHAMRIHCSLKHESIPRLSTRTPTVFKPELHSKAGMPPCRLCDRQFWRWTHLVQHIEKGACRCLGGQSDVLAPVPDDQVPADIQQPPTAELGIFGDENVMHVPLVSRRAFLEHLDSWERWLRIPAVPRASQSLCIMPLLGF